MSTHDFAAAEKDVLSSLVHLVSSIFDVPNAGVSNYENGEEISLVMVGENIRPHAELLHEVFAQGGKYLSSGTGEHIFFAGVEIKNNHQMPLALWIQDLRSKTLTQREFSQLENIAVWATHLLNSVSQVTQNDATKIIDVQRELSNKNRNLAEADARRKAMLENIGDGVVGIDAKGEIIYANPAIEKLTGWKKEELLGKFFMHAFILKDDKGNEVPAEHRPMRNALYNNQKVESKNFFLQRKNGSTFAVSVTATPVILYEQTIGGVNVMRDITKEREIDKMKTEFISLASHQLRTPLSSMRWFTEMLLDGEIGDLTPEQKDVVESIYEGNQRMIVLVNTLLNISRIESGRIIIEPEPTDVFGLVNEVLAELKPKIAEKGHSVSVKTKEELPKINIDPKLIRHVYLNLLNNAIKYTRSKGHIEVELSISGNELISKISDTGLGIPEKDQDKIFTKFFRADNVTKIETEGSGLGLYLVNAIVQSAGGKIWFESRENEGTTFTLVLPLSGSVAKQGVVRIS